MTEHDLLKGRWYREFRNAKLYAAREQLREASWDNVNSFWVRREDLLQTIQDVGFDIVMEQFDGLGPNIRDSMLTGYYRQHNRGTFLGIKSSTDGRTQR